MWPAAAQQPLAREGRLAMRTLNLGLGLLVAAALASGATESKSVKLVGCLEHDTPASSAMATNASQITAFKLSAIDPNDFKAATSSAGIDTPGPAELRLRSDDDFKLLDHVGRRVEIKGRFEDDPSTTRPAGGLAISAQGVVPWLPLFRVTSLDTVASTCR